MKTMSEILGRKFRVEEIIQDMDCKKTICKRGGRMLLNHIEPSLDKPFFKREIYPSKAAAKEFGSFLRCRTSMTCFELQGIFDAADVPANLFMTRRKDNRIPQELLEEYFPAFSTIGEDRQKLKVIFRGTEFKEEWKALNRNVMESVYEYDEDLAKNKFVTERDPNTHQKIQRLMDALDECNVEPRFKDELILPDYDYYFYVMELDLENEVFRVVDLENAVFSADDFQRKCFTVRSLLAEYFKETLCLHKDICKPRR